MDRLVPYAAVFVLLLCGFCFYGVSSGLFTGVKPIPETAIADDLEKIAPTEVAAPTPLPEKDARAAKGEEKNLVSLTAYAPMDVGFTAYVLENVPKDALLLWDELARLGAMPAGITLESFRLEGESLTLSFNEALQTRMTASATDDLVVGIVKTFSALYPEVTALSLESAGAPLTFHDKKIDTAPLFTKEVSVTDTKTAVYGEKEQE
ncbi:MAG: hypothetical protein RSC76_05725 [Oscillospiraceae bacterium]